MKEKNQKSNDKDFELLDKLRFEASIPDGKFKQKLKEKVIAKYNENNLIFNFFGMKNFKIAGLFIFFMLIISIGGYFVYKSFVKKENKTEIIALSPAEKKDILSGILKNNQPNTLKSASLNNASLASAEKADIMPLKAYSYSKVVSKSGPKIDSCKAYSYDTNTTTEVFSYQNLEKKQYYQKIVKFDENGKLINLFLNLPEYMIFYFGGDYAAREKITVSYQVQSIEDKKGQEDKGEFITTIDPTEYFGEGAKVEKVLENGKLIYYLVTWDYETSCDPLMSSSIKVSPENIPASTSIIIEKQWYDPSSMIMKKSQTYLTEEKPENLIRSSESETEQSDVEFSKVQSNFEFNLNVPIKDFEKVDYNEETMLKIYEKALKEENLSIIIGKNNSLKPSYIYSDKIMNEMSRAGANYFADRDFYPKGDQGDRRYEEMNPTWNDSTYKLEYVLNASSYSVSAVIYNQSASLSSLMNKRYGENAKKIKSTEIVVDGKKVFVDVYEVKGFVSGDYDYSQDLIVKDDPNGEENSPEEVSVEIAFQFNGLNYFFNVVADKQADLLKTEFVSLNSNNDSQRSVILAMLKEYLSNPISF